MSFNRTRKISLTLRVCSKVKRDDRNVHDTDIRRPVYLQEVY